MRPATQGHPRGLSCTAPGSGATLHYPPARRSSLRNIRWPAHLESVCGARRLRPGLTSMRGWDGTEIKQTIYPPLHSTRRIRPDSGSGRPRGNRRGEEVDCPPHPPATHPSRANDECGFMCGTGPGGARAHQRRGSGGAEARCASLLGGFAETFDQAKRRRSPPNSTPSGPPHDGDSMTADVGWIGWALVHGPPVTRSMDDPDDPRAADEEPNWTHPPGVGKTATRHWFLV